MNEEELECLKVSSRAYVYLVVGARSVVQIQCRNRGKDNASLRFIYEGVYCYDPRVDISVFSSISVTSCRHVYHFISSIITLIHSM